MSKYFNYIIIVLAISVIVYSVYLNTKIKFLERENLELKINQTDFVDSLKTENLKLEIQLDSLNDNLVVYKKQVDSLLHVKQSIVYTFNESETITAGVLILKNNLKWESL